MGKRKHKKSRSGHYCWSCDCNRPNEKFSGKGHGKHLCKVCSKLGADVLAYRQALRNLERCVTWEGIIPRKRRKQFQQFLEHADPRIREFAQEMQHEDAIARRRLHAESQDWEEDRPYIPFESSVGYGDDNPAHFDGLIEGEWDDHLPF